MLVCNACHSIVPTDYFAQVPYRVKRVDFLRINIGSGSTKIFSSNVSIHSDYSELLSAQPIQGPIGMSFDSRVVSFLYRCRKLVIGYIKCLWMSRSAKAIR